MFSRIRRSHGRSAAMAGACTSIEQIAFQSPLSVQTGLGRAWSKLIFNLCSELVKRPVFQCRLGEMSSSDEEAASSSIHHYFALSSCNSSLCLSDDHFIVCDNSFVYHRNIAVAAMSSILSGFSPIRVRCRLFIPCFALSL
jgi:hypothetical protein